MWQIVFTVSAVITKRIHILRPISNFICFHSLPNTSHARFQRTFLLLSLYAVWRHNTHIRGAQRLQGLVLARLQEAPDWWSICGNPVSHLFYLSIDFVIFLINKPLRVYLKRTLKVDTVAKVKWFLHVLGEYIFSWILPRNDFVYILIDFSGS